MKTEYTAIGVNGVRVISEEEAKTNTTENIYYLEGLTDDYVFEKGKRAKDEDIQEKTYFVLDLDIRNNCDFEITNEEIIEEGKKLAEFLKEDHEYFGEYSKIVFTGNGLHIYYSGKAQHFEKEEYSLGVSRIYKNWDEYMGTEEYKCDRACKNLARILRLPGSVNQKNGAKVEIIIEQEKESRLFEKIKAFAKKEKQEQTQREEQRQREVEERLKNFDKTQNNFYETINSLPAFEIAMRLVPEFPYDGKKNFKNKEGGYTGYFYNKDTNTIVNGGSRYFDWGDSGSGWNNFSLVKHFYDLSDAETFTFYKKILGK